MMQPTVPVEYWNHLVALATTAQDAGTSFERALSVLIVNFFDDSDGGGDVTVPPEWVEQGSKP